MLIGPRAWILGSIDDYLCELLEIVVGMTRPHTRSSPVSNVLRLVRTWGRYFLQKLNVSECSS